EIATAGLVAYEHETEELEGFRLRPSALLAVLRREAAELDQARLVRMQRQRNLLQPFAHRIPEAAGVIPALEADDDVVGVPHHDHVARGLAPSPALGPEIEDVVEIDVGEQRRNHRTLTRPCLLDRHDPVFENAGPQPFLDEPEDALVADPVFEEADDPLLGNFREERPDIGVEYEIHLLAADADEQRVQRIVLAAPRSESVREPEESFLVVRAKHLSRRPLDDLVFQRGDRERASAAVFFRNISPT